LAASLSIGFREGENRVHVHRFRFQFSELTLNVIMFVIQSISLPLVGRPIDGAVVDEDTIHPLPLFVNSFETRSQRPLVL
jgi:hypothetical protein